MIGSVLIANRGEIALRIVRGARECGIRTIAVHSEADRLAPHVLAADEAYEIGPAPSSESYLRADRLIEVAKRVGADAIHPGYGFLAERADFARAVEEAGLVFVGPVADTISAMGVVKKSSSNVSKPCSSPKRLPAGNALMKAAVA